MYLLVYEFILLSFTVLQKADEKHAKKNISKTCNGQAKGLGNLEITKA